jgi:hypothetical protein
MISLGGHGEIRGSNLMGNMYIYITCIFSLIPEMPPVSLPVMINIKQCMVHETFFVFKWCCEKKAWEQLYWTARNTWTLSVTVTVVVLRVFLYVIVI